MNADLQTQSPGCEILANNFSHSWTKYYSIINIPQLCLQLSFEWLKFLSFFVYFIFFVKPELVQFLLMFPQTLQFNKQRRDERDPGLREDGWVTNNYYMYMINKQPLFGKKICTNICLQTLSVPRCKQFFESKAQGKLWTLRNRECPRKKIFRNNLAQNRGYCIYCPSSISECVWKNVYEQLTVYSMGYFLLSVPWYDLMNKKIFSFFCNTHKTLSHLELNLKHRLIVVDIRFKNWGILVEYILGYHSVLVRGYLVT